MASHTLTGSMQFVLTLSGGDGSMSSFVGEFRGAVEAAHINFEFGELAAIDFTGMILEHKLGSLLKDKENMPIRVIRIGNPKKK